MGCYYMGKSSKANFLKAKKYFPLRVILLALGFIIVCILGIPTGIHWLFKQNATCDFFQAEWDAGDVLSFYGALLAAASTIVGVYLSVQAAQRSYREDEKRRVRPYLAITHFKTKSRISLFNGQAENTETEKNEFYQEFKLQRVYVIIKQDTVVFTDQLSKEQKRIVERAGFSWKPEGKGHYIPEFKNYLSMPFQIDNVGGGVALNSQLIFAKDGTKRRGVTFYTLKPDDNFYFHIFSESITDEMYGTYTLELRYDDILGNSYSQKYPIELKDDPVDGKFTWSFDLSESQCEIGR